MTAREVPWTRAERTREIGYADAMLEMAVFARELKDGFRPAPLRESSAFPAEVAYVLGLDAGLELIEHVLRYATAAYFMYLDPAMFGKDVSRVSDGDFYGVAPAEPGGSAPEPSAPGGTS